METCQIVVNLMYLQWDLLGVPWLLFVFINVYKSSLVILAFLTVGIEYILCHFFESYDFLCVPRSAEDGLHEKEVDPPEMYIVLNKNRPITNEMYITFTFITKQIFTKKNIK